MIGYVTECHRSWLRCSRIVFCFDIQENCVPRAIQNWHTKWLLLLSWQFSHLIEENSASIASDEQRGLCVTGLNYEGANLSIRLPPGRRATTIGEHIICGGRIYALEICIFCYMYNVSNVKLVHCCHFSTAKVCNKTSSFGKFIQCRLPQGQMDTLSL